MNRQELLPESMTLYPSKIKWVLVILVSIGFFALGIYTIESDDTGILLGQVICVMFSLVILWSTLTLWPGSGWLKLGPDGIRNKVIFRKFHYRWSDINRFGIWIVQDPGLPTTTKYVSFWMKPDDQMRSLSECYGKKPEELVKILESYRNRYG